MSLNVFDSIKVTITLKSLAKTTSEIRDVKHRVLTPSNAAIPNGFSRWLHLDTRQYLEILIARAVVPARPKVLPT